MLTFSIQKLFIDKTHSLLLYPLGLWRKHSKIQTTIYLSIHPEGLSQGPSRGPLGGLSQSEGSSDQRSV